MRKATSVLSFIAGLALLMFSATTPVVADPPGFNGTVKIHEEPGEAEPIRRNEPHVCVFHVHGFNFDANATGWFRIDAWAPTAGNAGLSQRSWGPASAAGEWRSGAITLAPGHYKLFFDQTVPQAPGAEKHKVFWVECETQGTSSTTGGSTGTSTSSSSSSGTSTTTNTSTSTTTTTSTTGSASSSTSTSTGNANSSSTGNANSSSTGNANSTTGGGSGSGSTSTTGSASSSTSTTTGGSGSGSTSTTTGGSGSGSTSTSTGGATTTTGANVGTTATANAVAGVAAGTTGGVVAGVETLPATSTDGTHQLLASMGAALTLIGTMLMLRRKPETADNP